jgi:hypothetical protein
MIVDWGGLMRCMEWILRVFESVFWLLYSNGLIYFTLVDEGLSEGGQALGIIRTKIIATASWRLTLLSQLVRRLLSS